MVSILRCQLDTEPKKLGKPHITQSISASPNPSASSSINVLSSKPRTSLFSIPINFTFTVKALIDTGAFCSAMPLNIFTKLQKENPASITHYNPTPSSIRVANGSLVPTYGTFKATFNIANEKFTETFLLLKTMNQTILGLPFFEKNDICIHPKSRTLKLPNLTLQLTEKIHHNGKISAVTPKKNHFLKNNSSISINPNTSEIVKCSLPNCSYPDGTVAIIEPFAKFENQTGLCVTSALITIKAKEDISLAILNVLPHKVTVQKNSIIARITILTPKQAEYLQPINPQLLTTYFNENINALIQDSDIKVSPSPDEFWFPTPENCSNPEKLTGIDKRIYDEITKLKNDEKLDPISNQLDKQKFLAQFPWKNSVFNEEQKHTVENLLLEYHHIFARHRLDIGKNEDFKVKLTPEHNEPMYTQGPPTPIHYRDEVLVELSLLQYWGVITTLTYSKYSSPIFAVRKPSGKLRLLVDLRRINHLIRHGYDNHNFPIATLADVSAHLAGKKFFAKLDCSQAYHVLQMADPLSVQLLSFNFLSRTFAYLRLAQGLSRSVSAFSSFMRKYLYPCIVADQCFQYVDDLGTAACTFEEFITNLRAIFVSIEKAGLKFSPGKCEFGLKEMTFLGNTITTAGTQPDKKKVSDFLSTLKVPKTPKQIRRFIGFFQYFRAFIPKLGEKLLPFYKLLRQENETVLTEEHHKQIEALKKDLEQACTLSLRLPKANAQYVILTDASFYAAGYVLMIEDYITDQSGKTYKTYVPVSFGSKIFTPTYLKLSIYAKEFLAVHFVFDNFAHILWGSTKPVLVLTDNRSLTRFFQAKTIPSSLWTCVDHVLNFNFVLGHIPGKANAAADYLSRIHVHPHTKLELRFNSQIPVKNVQLKMGMQVPDNSVNTIRYDCMPFRLGRTKHKAFEALNSLHAPNPLDDLDLTDKMTPLNLREEQQKDPNIKLVLHWMDTHPPQPSPYLSSELRKYLKHFNRLENHQGVLYRKFFDDTGKVVSRQYVVPAHLRAEILYRIHNSKTAGHIGITKTAQIFRQKFYFPNFVEFLTNYIKNCSSCLQVKPVKHATLKPPLLSLAVDQHFPGDLLQIDIVGKLPDSGGFTHILTAKDVFSKYLFAIPLRNASAPNVAKQLFHLFMRNSYIPKTVLSDMGTAFTAKIMTELSKLLEITMQYATVKHPQTVGSVERTHASLKQYLGIYGNKLKKDWHTYVDLAAFVHNTSYHVSIGCTPTYLFHGREPVKPLDVRFNLKTIQNLETRYEFTSSMQDRMNEVFSAACDARITAYNKYRTFYDRKANAAPLSKHRYCLLLNPKLATVNDHMGKSLNKWIPLYRVEQVLTNSNYIVRKVGTNYTQCVHRIRLRPITPQYQIEDLAHIHPNNFVPDPSTRHTSEPSLFDSTLPDLLSDKSFMPTDEVDDSPSVLFY